MIPLGVLSSRRPAAAVAPLAITYRGSSAAGTAIDIGPDDPNRWVIAAWTGETYRAVTPTGVAIAGIPAVLDYDAKTYAADSYLPRILIARAHVPTGGAAALAMTGGGTSRRSAIHVWTVERDLTVVGAADTSTSLLEAPAAPGGLAIVAGTHAAGFPYTIGEVDYRGVINGREHAARGWPTSGGMVSLTVTDHVEANVRTALVTYLGA